MCDECLRDGTMTKEEVEKQKKDGQELINAIANLCIGKEEVVIMNSLLSSITNFTKEFGAEPSAVIQALLMGFGVPVVAIPMGDILEESLKREIKH